MIVYSKTGCPHCDDVKATLDHFGVTYTAVDLTNDAARQEFYYRTGTRTVPQVYTRYGEYVGGADRLPQWLGEHL